MVEKRGRSVIHVFRMPDQALTDGCVSGVCSQCGSQASCSEPKETFEEMLTRLYLGFGDRADVELHVVDTQHEPVLTETVDTLNRMLAARKEDARVTKETIEEFMSQRAPLIGVDDVLFFVGVVPTNRQMERALDIMSRSPEGHEDAQG